MRIRIFLILLGVVSFAISSVYMLLTIRILTDGVVANGTLTNCSIGRGGANATVTFTDQKGIEHKNVESNDNFLHGCPPDGLVTLRYLPDDPGTYRLEDHLQGEPWISIFLWIIGTLLATISGGLGIRWPQIEIIAKSTRPPNRKRSRKTRKSSIVSRSQKQYSNTKKQ
jgi:hypothetical protein